MIHLIFLVPATEPTLGQQRKCESIRFWAQCFSKGRIQLLLEKKKLNPNNSNMVVLFDFLIIQQPGSLLSTSCGSPSYVAPEASRLRGVHEKQSLSSLTKIRCD